MQILDVDHVQITVSAKDIEQARHFYLTVLKLPEIEKPEALQSRGGFWMHAGSTPVHVGTEEGVERLRTKVHVAYAVDDLEAWRTHLVENGIQPIASIPIPGYARFECRDPFGNRFELIQAL